MGAGGFKRHRDDVLVHRAQRTAEQLLSRFAVRCVEANVPYKLLEDSGNPVERILLESQRFDLIVLGQRTYFDSTTQDAPCNTVFGVLRNAPRPVVVAPSALAADGPVIVAYDGSVQAARALQAFQSLGLYEGQKTYVVSIGNSHKEAAISADRAMDFLSYHKFNAETRIVTSSLSVGHVLLNEAEKVKAGLIVMGAYGKPILQEFFFGSVTKVLMESSPVPLFLYH